MPGGDTLPTPQALDACPRCSAPSGTLSLLTSMARYYVCGGCQFHWQASRMDEHEPPAGNRTLQRFR